MIKLIVYDLDGTLIDSSKDISNSINWALERLGFSGLPEQVIRKHIGSGVEHLIRNVLNEVLKRQPLQRDGLLDEMLGLYRSRYSSHLLDETKLYPGVQTTLEFFKDRKQSVITNKSEEFSRRILKGLGVDHYFFQVIGGDQAFAKKPAPDSVLNLVASARVMQAETIFIGDSEIDIQTAKNAKIKIVAVTYGFNSRSEIEIYKPDLIVDRLDELTYCDLIN